MIRLHFSEVNIAQVQYSRQYATYAIDILHIKCLLSLTNAFHVIRQQIKLSASRGSSATAELPAQHKQSIIQSIYCYMAARRLYRLQ